jgi:hypothetical protein
LRKVEQAVLKHRRGAATGCRADSASAAIVTPTVDPATPDPPEADSASDVVLAYCTAVRGLLNDDQGGPLHPPGLRMADALNEVRDSIQRNVDAKKGDSLRSNSGG